MVLGYADSPIDLAAGRTIDELRTGDVARRAENGLFEIVGRRGRFIKTRCAARSLALAVVSLRTRPCVSNVSNPASQFMSEGGGPMPKDDHDQNSVTMRGPKAEWFAAGDIVLTNAAWPSFFDGEPNVEACAALLIDDAVAVLRPGHEDLPPIRRGHAVWRQRVPASPGPRPPWPERAPRARRPERHGRCAIVPDESLTPFLMLRTRSKTPESRRGGSWSVTVYRSRGPPYHHVAFNAHGEDESLRHV